MNDQQQQRLEAAEAVVRAADAYLQAYKRTVEIRAKLFSSEDDADTRESRESLQRQADAMMDLERKTNTAMALMQ